MADTPDFDLTTLTVQLLSAYVSNNIVASGDLAGLIQSTRAALAPQAAPVAEAAPEYVPATTIRKSLASPNGIISMIDGKTYQTLKRHLGRHGLTPADYIARYNLPKDYPMVAPAYSERRREVAKALGLGRKRVVTSEAAPPAETVAEPAAPPAKARKPRAPKTDAPAAAPVAAEKPRRGRKPGAAKTG